MVEKCSYTSDTHIKKVHSRNTFQLKHRFPVIIIITIFASNIASLSLTHDQTYAQSLSKTDTANAITQKVSLGKRPLTIAINPNTNKVYVVEINPRLRPDAPGTVSVIDGKEDKVVGNVTVGKRPEYIAINPNTNKVYVGNWGSGTVSVIDGKEDKVVGNVTVGRSHAPTMLDYTPFPIAINPNTNKVYVGKEVNLNTSQILVIDGQQDKLVRKVTVGFFSTTDSMYSPLIINPNTNKVYVGNGDSVSVIRGEQTNLVQQIR